MALIQKIRGMSALVLTLMFLAIFAFIAMLILQDANPNGNANGVFGNSTTLAKVAGQSIDVTEFDRKAEILGNNADLNSKNALFNFWVENAILEKEANKLGVGVSKDELIDLQFGMNPSTYITQNPNLVNQQTGQVDPQQLQQLKTMIQNNTMPVETKRYWAELERQIIKDRVQTKMSNLMNKAIYTPTWLVDDEYANMTAPSNIEFVRLPFSAVDDKDAPVSDSDIQAYMNEYKARFTNEEESRIFEFVAFPVTPSAEDSAKLRNKLLSIRDSFRTTKKDSLFVVSNGSQFIDRFENRTGLSPVVKDSIFNLPVGSVYGPYVDGKTFVMAKVVDRRSSIDSVRSRHILIQGAGAQKTADSLAAIITANPTRWDSINLAFNMDASVKPKGGDLDFQPQGMFVPQFNDLLFFKNPVQGKTYTVATQFGVHIIQVTGTKGKVDSRTKIAFIRENIAPSAETDRNIRAAANDLLATSKTAADLQKNALAKGMALQPAPAVRANDNYLAQFGASTGVRSIIRWMFDASVGERGKEVYSIQEQGSPYVSNYVVGTLKQIYPKGLMTVEAMKDNVTPTVRNRKKGEILKNKIGKVSDLASLAVQYGVAVENAPGLTFNVTTIPNAGAESKVIAAAASTPIGSISAPIVGEAGVYVIRVAQRDAVTNSPVDKNILRMQMAGQVKNTLQSSWMRLLKKGYDVTDNRAKFY
jgi:peptidyl-prolyl cis-trans isomerase D